MKVAVCDDDTKVTRLMGEYVKEYFGDKCTVDLFNSGLEFCENPFEYDIIFLDINMGNFNGIDLAKQIRNINKRCFIIFITNYNQYCSDAFGVHAFEYIMKPINKEKIFNVLLEIQNYKISDKQEQYIKLKSDVGIIQGKICDISYFEYSDRKVKMVSDFGTFIVLYSLEEIKELLENDDFIMPHRAFVINMRKIKIVKRFDIIMENGAVIPIAQKKATSFKKNFVNYLYKQI